MKPKTIIVLILLALFLIILLQNTKVVKIQLLFWKIGMSRIIMLPITLFLGIVIGFIIGKTKKRRGVKSDSNLDEF